MGSDCCAQNKCPSHPDQSINIICVQQHCFQPLCNLCKHSHQEKHREIGHQAIYRKVQEVENQADKKLSKYTQEVNKRGTSQQSKETSVLLKKTVNDFIDKTKVKILEQRSTKNQQTKNLFKKTDNFASLILYQKGIWNDFRAEVRKADLLIQPKLFQQMQSVLKR